MLSNVLKISSNFVHSNLSVFSRNLTCSPILNSMPAKKRRKIDPAVLKAREEKRKKRLAKALKKMEKKQRIMRPMTEIEPNPILLKEREKRARNIEISEEIEEERIELFKEWSRFANQRHKKEIRQIDTVLISQREALEALRQLDQDLYKEAISVDLSLIPFKAKGPFFSPPIPEYLQDGEYENVTKEFQVQYADMNEFMHSITKKKVKKKKTQQDEE